jgi:heterodisulfide reductase subunit A-like polyferredoxin
MSSRCIYIFATPCLLSILTLNFVLMKAINFILSLITFIPTVGWSQKISQTKQTEVLVIGGTASGICAGLQSARLGVYTIIAESTPWLGGMLTAAGVSAID